MPSIFPLEIEEMILDHLAEDDEGYPALKMCSLVCQAFLPICRKHIFGSIVLNDYRVVSPPTTHAFERLLRETPEIAGYIRKLDYNIRIVDFTSPSIQESLKRISRLKSLSVQHSTLPRLDWSNNPIRPGLLHLLHLPTLTHFQVTCINNVVVSDLIPCVNLQYLNIGLCTTVAAENTFPAALPEHSIQQSIQLNEFVAGTETATTIMKLCTARRPDGQPIIDFGSLSKIKVVFRDRNRREGLLELFRRCHVLTNAQISFWNPRNVRPSVADVLRPSMQTLKHIVVNIDVIEDDDDDDDPLFGIPSEFEDMRTTNIIETVTIGMQVRVGRNCPRGDDWGRLDKVLTTPGWFSLKRVSLAIKIFSFDPSTNIELEMALRKLPETQFPRLSSSNSVSFDFEVTSSYP